MICTILVNYNGIEDTQRCIRSLNGGTVATDVVVVDNASTDGGLEQLEQFANVVLLRQQENVGFGRGNNVGISYALKQNKYTHIFILNNDALVSPTAVATLLHALDCRPDVGAVCPRIVFAEAPHLLWYGGGEVDWKRGSAVVPNFRQSAWSDSAETTREVTFATGCAMLVHSDFFRHVGGFNTNYFMYEEDVELSIRAAKSGQKMLYVADALVYHRALASSRTSADYVAPLSAENPNLTFYLYHRIYNRLITVTTHATRVQFLQFVLYFSVYWGYKSLRYIAFGRIDALFAIARAVTDFGRADLNTSEE